MRKILLLSILLISKVALAQTDTITVRQSELLSLQSKVDSIFTENKQEIKLIINDIEIVNKKASELLNKNIFLEKELLRINKYVNRLEDTLSVYNNLIQSNTNLGKSNTSSIKDIQNKLQTEIDYVNKAIISGDTELDDNISRKTLFGIVAFLLSVITTAILAVLLYRRSKTDISKLKKQAEILNEKIIEKLATEVSEISKITTSATPSTPTPDHSLIKVLADRITFMEMTLYKMDNSIRGHKQLSKSIKQMKDNLLANGYEIVEMLGKPYHEGMKVLPNFIEDDSIEEGKQIITGIIKPQINFNGEMIQSAQITVSQN